MSMDPAYNPYTPTFADDRELGGSKGPLTGFVKVVCIFFIVLGVLGLLQTLQIIAGMVFILSMDEKQFNPLKIFPGAMALAILVGFINFVVSVCQIVGGVLSLKQKRLGANLIRFVSGFMLIFKIAETAYGCVVNYLSIGPTIEQTMKQMPPQPANAPDFGMFIEIGMYIAIGFAIFMGLTMFFFYLFAFLSFSKKETLSQFS